MTEKTPTTQDLLNNITEGIFKKKGNDVVSLNLSKLENSICDYFIICHAESTTQVAAIATSVEDMVEENLHISAWHKDGYKNAIWILLDFGEVVVHVFQREAREFYNLEDLWADGYRTVLV